MTPVESADDKFDTGEVVLAYTRTGSGPAALLLHGAGLSRNHWAPVLPAFTDRLSAYVIDQRGHGDSGRAAAYRYVDFSRDAVAFLRDCIREPTVLIGHSMGGVVAAQVAAEVPELVRGAVLVDPGLFRIMPRYSRMFAALEELVASNLTPEQIAERMVAEGFSNNRDTAERNAPDQARTHSAVFGTLKTGEYRDGLDIESILAGIRCPVLLAYDGEGAEPVLTREEANRVVSDIPTCTAIAFPGAGHGIHRSRSQEFNAAVIEFLKEVGG